VHQTDAPSIVESNFFCDTMQLVPSRAMSRVGFSLPCTVLGPKTDPERPSFGVPLPRTGLVRTSGLAPWPIGR
jgi:hypothetical protein